MPAEFVEAGLRVDGGAGTAPRPELRVRERHFVEHFLVDATHEGGLPLRGEGVLEGVPSE